MASETYHQFVQFDDVSEESWSVVRPSIRAPSVLLSARIRSSTNLPDTFFLCTTIRALYLTRCSEYNHPCRPSPLVGYPFAVSARRPVDPFASGHIRSRSEVDLRNTLPAPACRDCPCPISVSVHGVSTLSSRTSSTLAAYLLAHPLFLCPVTSPPTCTCAHPPHPHSAFTYGSCILYSIIL